MSDVRTLLKKRPLLFDGGMGTYYKGAPGRECEQANRLDPEGIRAVHRAYLAAGADAIKTNTFGLPRMAAAQDPEWEALADAGWKLAAEAAAGTDAAVFADLGPAPDTENLPAEQVYLSVAKRFALLGARNFLFETLSTEEGVLEAICALKQTVPEAFVLVSQSLLTATQKSLIRTLRIIMAGMIGAIVLLVFFLSRWMTKPVECLQNLADISVTHYSHSL